MELKDIYKIENELKIKLPESYKSVMQCHPFEDNKKEPNITFCLINNVDEIIKENKEIQKEGFLGTPWKANLFVIGKDGAGNYYYINLNERINNKVFVTDFTFEEGEELNYIISNSLTDFIEFKIEIKQESESD